MDALRKLLMRITRIARTVRLPGKRFPPGGKTSALVETINTWSGNVQSSQTNTFRTIGLDSDQISAAI